MKKLNICIWVLVFLNLVSLTSLLCLKLSNKKFEKEKIVNELNINTSDKEVEETNKITSFMNNQTIYTSDFEQIMNGNCVPVAISNIIKFCKSEAGDTEYEITEDIFKKIAKNCKTGPTGGTQFKNIKTGINKSFEDENIDAKVKSIRFDLWDEIKESIDDGRPIILINYKYDKILYPNGHAYIVVGYTGYTDGTKAVYCYTGWDTSPYEVIGINQDNQTFYFID